MNTTEQIDVQSQSESAPIQGFVSGTLVHTLEGRKPIEQIKVGDQVLAGPQSGEGEATAQPVTQVFEYQNRELYFLPITEVDENLKYHRGNRFEGVAVTGGHPIWIDQYRQKTWEGEIVVTQVSAWVSVENYYLKAWKIWEHAELDNRLSEPKAYGRLSNGRLVSVGIPSPILKGHKPNEGVLFEDHPGWEGQGITVVFGPDGVQWSDKETGLGWNAADANYDYTGYDTVSPMSVVVRSKGHLPIRRTVYNLEVANTHSYFVGDQGLWAHDVTVSESLLQSGNEL